MHLFSVGIGALRYNCLLGNGQCFGFQNNLVQVIHGDFIVFTKNEAILVPHVLCDPEFGFDIFLEVVVISVQVVRCDIQQYGYVCPEVVHAVELETA